jgi:hypothetical protein
MSYKIFPRNLTARAAYRAVGNPESTRLESGVADCYPGLEFDHRNLDRRFFPGLVFEFVSQADALVPNPARSGARLVSIDTTDPDLAGNPSPELTTLLAELNGPAGTALGTGTWFLDEIEQGGRRITLSEMQPDGTVQPLDGLVVWRLVRCLESGPVRIKFVSRGGTSTDHGPLRPAEIELHGWRRRFVDPNSGVLSKAYEPGELSQSLCSPWQHDFRDCGCHYWASNHPDLVLADDRLDERELMSGISADPARAMTRIDWLRSDRARDRAAAALGNRDLNRALEMDHYEINQRWQELAIVVGGKETPSVYEPRSPNSANPFGSPDELAANIQGLAPLEHVLALEYLYAYFSVKSPAEAEAETAHWPTLTDDVTFIRHFIQLVAVGEMQHLRWANQLLWEMVEARLIKPGVFNPSLGVAEMIPNSAAGPPRNRALRPLTPASLADFVAVEMPSGTIEGQYARVTATLRLKDYPDSLFQLASRIVNDGTEHYQRFRDIGLILSQYPTENPPYLRAVTVGTEKNPQVKAAMNLYRAILDDLRHAYTTGRVPDLQNIIDARKCMVELNTLADDLAGHGVGIPFFPPVAG